MARGRRRSVSGHGPYRKRDSRVCAVRCYHDPTVEKCGFAPTRVRRLWGRFGQGVLRKHPWRYPLVLRAAVSVVVFALLASLGLPAALTASDSATRWYTLERIKYATSQSDWVGTVFTTDDVLVWGGKSKPLRPVTLKVTSRGCPARRGISRRRSRCDGQALRTIAASLVGV